MKKEGKNLDLISSLQKKKFVTEEKEVRKKYIFIYNYI